MALLKSGMRELPFMKAALVRHLQELPWTSDGLSLTEREALAALAKGPLSAAEVFAAAQLKRDPQPFMGDLFFWSVVRDLIEAPRPPVAVAPRPAGSAWPKRVLRLTPTGKALLAGKLDWQDDRPLDRWVGGIAVAPRRTGVALEPANGPDHPESRVDFGGLWSYLGRVALRGRPRRAEGYRSGRPGLQRGRVHHGVVHSFHCRYLRDRLGRRIEIHRGLFTVSCHRCLPSVR